LISGEILEGKVRKSGGGRKIVEESYPAIGEAIRKLIDNSTYGNPERVLSYTIESFVTVQCIKKTAS